jgi:hypothetical protein
MLERTIWDLKNGTAEVVFADGRSRVFRSPKLVPSEDTAIRKAAVDYRRWRMTLELPLGPVDIELGWPGKRDQPPRTRPVVYLDQNHWSTLAAATWRPSARVAEREKVAASRIVELARDRAILLPFSSGHAVETGPLYGERRLQHASMVLELSGGWQMRNPIAIRARELQQDLAGEDPRAPGVFTLEPNVLFASQGPRPPSGGPIEETLKRLSWLTAVYETFLDEEEPDMNDARAKADRWAAVHKTVASSMAGLRSQEERRHMAREFLLTDLRIEIATAATVRGVSPARTATWHAERLNVGLGSLPYVGRWEKVLFHRLSNTGERWVASDLLDLNFLSAAAAYADVVVGERQTSEYLSRAQRAAMPGAIVCSKLHDALPSIETLVATRAQAAA